ncbi:MAG: PLP-dependent aminotransferase family protein [Lachnospiraceae bacterium]
MIELMIPLDSGGEKALYEQIYEYIRTEIADGKFSCGERLPSTRLLAQNLQVSRSTVEYAYDQLLSEGYIESQPYRGYFVSDVTELYQMQGQNKEEQMSYCVEPRRGPKEEQIQIDFNPYSVDLKQFPYNVWKKCSRQAWQNPKQMFLSSGQKGEFRLRREICKYLHQARGVNCSPHQVIIGAGNEYLLLLLSQILENDRHVAMESPSFMQAYRIFSNLQYKVSSVEMDENGLCIDELQKTDADIVYVMPSHQFPLGVVMSMKRRLELLKWAEGKEGRYIIEDDHDSEFRYRGKPIPSLQSIDVNGRVIYMGTFSKSIASAVRVGYMVLPESLLRIYEKKCGFYAVTVPKFQQDVLYYFLESGGFERNLNRMRGIYKSKHDFLTAELKKATWVHRVYGDHAGLHVLVEVHTTFSEQELVQKLAEKGVKIYGLSEYFRNREEAENFGEKHRYPTILLGYGNLQEDEIRQGLEAIFEVLCHK